MSRWAAVCVLVAVVGSGCRDGRDTDVPPPGSVVRVFAASSLTEAFQALGERFTEAHPGIRVDFTFAPSATLVSEIGRGQAASVLATGDPATMQVAIDQGHAREPASFARNRLALVVADGNPKAIAGLEDLERDDVDFGMCEVERACGALAAAALDGAGVERTPLTRGENSRVVLGDVVAGAVDVGIVFLSTAALDDGAEVAARLDDHDAEYEITVLAGAVDRDGARAFVDFVLGLDGQAILAELGFEPV